jgi:deoxyribodipyrimidine photo-lyase
LTRAIHWFRNDLRLRDNAALAAACARADALALVFVFDERLLAAPTMGAPRVRFLLDCLARLGADLERRGQRLVVRRGDPARVLPRLARETRAGFVSFGRDTTPYATRRDARVRRELERLGVEVVTAKDRVVFEGSEVRRRGGGAYAVFTPYRRAWWARLAEEPERPRPAPRLPPPVRGVASQALPSAEALGFGGDPSEVPTGGEAVALRRLRRFLEEAVARYPKDRDRPAVDGTSRLSPYLRFGAISARTCVHAALDAAAVDPRLARGVEKWVDELVWREFYAALLEREPRLLREPQRLEYAAVVWERDPHALAAWREGRTGYPFVDAGMRQLLATGWMHNRVRMLAASFLVKDLLLDWRAGERWFLRRLVDGDPASNDGGWQWCAGTGTDASPWFRIFNPVTQGERFDPEGAYVRRFVPELRRVPDRFVHRPWEAPSPPAGYPPPRVDHAERRALALARYRAARGRRKRR